MPDQSIVSRLITDIGDSLHRWQSPILIATFGLPGAGKTEISRWLGRRLPVLVLSTDSIRLRYQLPSGPATHDVMYEVATKLLPINAALVFDGIPIGRLDRDRLREFAKLYQARSVLVYATASPRVIEARLRDREHDPTSVVAEDKFVITPEHFKRIASYLEEPDCNEDVWRIDTSSNEIALQLEPLEQELRKTIN